MLVTWDINYLSDKNLSVLIQGDYVNATGGGEQAFQSSSVDNVMGSYSWTIDKSMLQSKSSNNVTLFFFPVNPSADEPVRIPGPTVMVTNRPPEYYRQSQVLPTTKDLYIALPCIFVFILLCLFGGALWNRKTRRIGLGNVMGRRRGYGGGKSRAQRMGLSRKSKTEDIVLRERELTSDGQYRDKPEDEGTDITVQEERPFYFDDLRRPHQSRF